MDLSSILSDPNFLSGIMDSASNVNMNQAESKRNRKQAKSNVGSELAKTGVKTAANAVVPGAGIALDGLESLDDMISGNGEKQWKNYLGNHANPLDEIESLMEGDFLGAIPMAGDIIRAKREKKDALDQREKEQKKRDRAINDKSRAYYGSRGPENSLY